MAAHGYLHCAASTHRHVENASVKLRKRRIGHSPAFCKGQVGQDTFSHVPPFSWLRLLQIGLVSGIIDDAEAYQIVVLVHDDGHQPQVAQGEITLDVLLNLLF